jgi:hypothetical protein
MKTMKTVLLKAIPRPSKRNAKKIGNRPKDDASTLAQKPNHISFPLPYLIALELQRTLTRKTPSPFGNHHRHRVLEGRVTKVLKNSQ